MTISDVPHFAFMPPRANDSHAGGCFCCAHPFQTGSRPKQARIHAGAGTMRVRVSRLQVQKGQPV